MLEKVIRAEKQLSEMTEGSGFRVFAGFDGFVDAIVRPISEHDTYGNHAYFSTIAEFGKYLQGKARKGCSIELSRELRKSGGNAFLFADALAGMGIETTCVGAFGYPQVMDVFARNHQNLKLVSIGAPGQCSALEFSDGKVMLSDNSEINEMDYRLLETRIGEERLVRYVEGADILAFMNWSELRGCSDIWRGFLENIFPQVRSGERKRMFLDLSDCSCRGRTDILDMLGLIRSFSRYFAVTLSLNANEFQATGEILTLDEAPAGNGGATGKEAEMARRIREYCGLESLFIHLPDRAYGMDGEKEACVMTRFIKEPNCSTGGGDNFNAGLLFGLIHGLDMESAMVVGNAASGYYVTHGHSASRAEIADYLLNWEQELVMDGTQAAGEDVSISS